MCSKLREGNEWAQPLRAFAVSTLDLHGTCIWRVTLCVTLEFFGTSSVKSSCHVRVACVVSGHRTTVTDGEPVWPRGKALGW